MTAGLSMYSPRQLLILGEIRVDEPAPGQLQMALSGVGERPGFLILGYQKKTIQIKIYRDLKKIEAMKICLPAEGVKENLGIILVKLLTTTYSRK